MDIVILVALGVFTIFLAIAFTPRESEEQQEPRYQVVRGVILRKGGR